MLPIYLQQQSSLHPPWIVYAFRLFFSDIECETWLQNLSVTWCTPNKLSKWKFIVWYFTIIWNSNLISLEIYVFYVNLIGLLRWPLYNQTIYMVYILFASFTFTIYKWYNPIFLSVKFYLDTTYCENLRHRHDIRVSHFLLDHRNMYFESKNL